jgi:TrmH family RNA methyltransferase
VSLYALDLRQPVVWLFGNEGAGLSAELIVAAQQRVTIPLAVATESLNVAAAAAVCLFEAVRQRQ